MGTPFFRSSRERRLTSKSSNRMTSAMTGSVAVYTSGDRRMIEDDRGSIAIFRCRAHLALIMKKSLLMLSALAVPLLGQTFSDWTPPVNLGTTINTSSNDQFAFVAKNGLTLYFASDRPGGFGGLDIYVSHRASINDAWGAPQNLGPKINTDAMEHCPFVTPDGNKLIFASDRAGSVGLNDLHMAFRQNTQDDFAWDNDRNLTERNHDSEEQ